MKTLFRPYEYVTPEGRRGQIDMLLAVEFGPEAQEVCRMSQYSSCADTMLRFARDAAIDSTPRGLIWYNNTYEGGFDLRNGSGGAFKIYDMKWRRHVSIQGDTYSLSTGNYGLDADFINDDGFIVYWKVTPFTEVQLREIKETQQEFLRRLRVYEGLLSSGLRILQSAGRFSTCEELLSKLAKQSDKAPEIFRLMNWAGGGRYKP